MLPEQHRVFLQVRVHRTHIQFEPEFLAQRNHDEKNGFLTARDNNDVPITRIRKGHQRNSSCNVCICIVACGSVGASFESDAL